MKRTLLAGIAAVTLAFAPQIASAADAAIKKAAPVVAAAPTWTGFYLGINGGYLGERADATFRAPATGIFVGHDSWENTNGGVIGATVGFNWQVLPAWVIGVEADYDWSSVKGSTRTPALPAFGALAFANGNRIETVATVRARVGWVWGSALLYGTVGGAWVNGDDFLEEIAATWNSVSGDFNKSGIVYGAGVEFMMTRSLSLKFDALYYDLGTHSATVLTTSGGNLVTCGGGPGCQIDTNLNFWTIRAGINWKFNLGKWPVGKTPAVVAKY